MPAPAEIFRRGTAQAISTPIPPYFLTGLKGCSPSNSSPYVLLLSEFESLYAADGRRGEMIRRFRAELQRLSDAGVVAEAMLCGGSFLNHDKIPADLDGLVIYHIRQGQEVQRAIQVIRELSRPADGLDLRYCPSDAGSLTLVKITCFFHTLYMHNPSTDVIDRGCVLVDLSQ